MATTSLSWRPLPALPSEQLPMLLVSTSVSTDSYTIRVTDLANLWEEVMERKAIFRRSLAEDTSIDPTDSPQNMQAFLSRVESAFDPGHADHQESRLSLSVGEKPGDDALVFKLTCELPGLKPLKWPMFLHKCPPSHLGVKLVLPLLQTNLTKLNQLNSLLDIIHQKDVVITKVLDKLEATGTRLENVFTVLSAKQKVSRKVAEEKVKGLAPFDRREWDSRLAATCNSPRDVRSLACESLVDNDLAYQAAMDVYDSPDLDIWWTKLDSSSSIPIVDGNSSQLPKKAPSPPAPLHPQSTNDDDDDDFQVQSSPPRPTLAAKRETVENRAAPSGDSEADPQAPKIHQDRRRLGAIGSKTSPGPQQALSNAKHPSTTTAGNDSETESEDEDEDDLKAPVPDAPSSPAPVPASKPSPRKGALGRIGGGGKSVASSTASDPPEAQKGDSTSHPSRPKLGQIGRKAATGSSHDEGSSRGRPPQRQTPEETRETSAERANRKREQLQKDLEKKTVAGPARKKRKF